MATLNTKRNEVFKMRNYYTHTIPSMLNLAKASEDFLSSLPTEFSKKEFEALRAACPGKPMSFASARKYGIIVVVREEPCKRETTCEFWTNPVTGEKYTWDELDSKWSKEIASQFGVEYLVKFGNHCYSAPSFWGLPHAEETREVDCYRNIFRLDVEKFKSFL